MIIRPNFFFALAMPTFQEGRDFASMLDLGIKNFGLNSGLICG
jgi:hypothetical protein